MNRNYLIFILFLAAILCYSNIGGISIYILDEAKNATCAKEMFYRSDLIVPTFNAELRGDKPPLHYFFMMASYSVFGVTAFAARFFSSLMGVLTFLGAVWFTRRYFGSTAAIWVSFTILSSLMFIYEFHLSVPDPYLITLYLWANICFFLAWNEQRRWLYIPGYVFLALAFLAKGPVVLVLTGLGWLFYIALMRLPLIPMIREFRLWWGIPILILIAAPWFIAVHLKTSGQWTQMFFLDHNLNRFAETKEGHGGIPLLSVVFVFLVMFPAGVFLPRSIWQILRRRTNFVMVFTACMGIAPVVFFLFSGTVLPNYIMPGVPFLAVSIGVWLFHQMGKQAPRFLPEWIAALLVSIILPVAAWFGIHSEKVLSGLENMSLYLLPLPIFLLAGLFLRNRGSIRGGYFTAATGSILSLLMVAWIILPSIDARNPVVQSKDLWEQPAHYRYYERINPAYVFYLPEPVIRIEDLNEKQPEPVLIFSRSEYSDTLSSSGYEPLFRYRNLFESRETLIYGSRGDFNSGEVTMLE